MTNPFFKNCGPLKLKDIYNILKIKKENINKKTQIYDIADLNLASTIIWDIFYYPTTSTNFNIITNL